MATDIATSVRADGARRRGKRAVRLSRGDRIAVALMVGIPLVLTGGLIWFAQVSPHGSYLSDILLPSLLAALGLGFAFVPVTIAAVTGIRPDQAGLASGLVNTTQQVGGALGLAILVAVSNSTTTSQVGDGVRDRAVALTEGFQDAFLVGAGFALLGAILAATLISSRDAREHAEAARRGEAPAAIPA